MQVDRAAAAALAEDAQQSSNFAPVHTLLPFSMPTSSKPARVMSANEEAMWESIEFDDEINFGAGIEPDDTTDRRRVEREIVEADMWGATNLVGGFSGDSEDPILEEQEDEVLSDALCNAGMWFNLDNPYQLLDIFLNFQSYET